jgi:hypothetical protein
MNRITNPFSRDEYPDLTHTISNVVNRGEAQPLNEMPFVPPIVTPENAPVFALLYGALGMAWLTGVILDLPDTIRGKWTSMKRDYENGKLDAEAAKKEIRKFTTDTLNSIPKHWSPQRTRHLKSLLKAAEALAAARETQGSQRYGALVREIEAYVARWSKPTKANMKPVREDLQTPERAEQQRKRIKAARDRVIGSNRYNRTDNLYRLQQLKRIDAREKADTKRTWGVSEPHHIRGHDESTPRKPRKRRPKPSGNPPTSDK